MTQAIIILALASTVTMLSAQAPSDQPTFEVASVRPNHTDSPPSMTIPPRGAVVVTNVSTRAAAIRLKAERAVGPAPLSGHLLVMPNGQRRFWSDYGVLDKCLNPGEDKETLRREAFGR